MELDWTQKRDIDNAEDGRVCANPERQREDRYQSKTGALPQHFRPVTQVLPESLGPCPSPHLSRDFFDQTDVAEFPAHKLSGLRFFLTAFDSVARGHFKVRSDLFLEFLFSPPAPPEWKSHASLSFPSRFRMPAMASESRSQRERSAARCIFPAAVSW